MVYVSFAAAVKLNEAWPLACDTVSSRSPLAALVAAVPERYSVRLLIPSPSLSSSGSDGSAGLRPLAVSHSSGRPSPSESGSTVRVHDRLGEVEPRVGAAGL